MILLPQSSKNYDYRHKPPHLDLNSFWTPFVIYICPWFWLCPLNPLENGWPNLESWLNLIKWPPTTSLHLSSTLLLPIGFKCSSPTNSPPNIISPSSGEHCFSSNLPIHALKTAIDRCQNSSSILSFLSAFILTFIVFHHMQFRNYELLTTVSE